MKKLALLLIVAVLTSCTSVHFEVPQPMGGEKQSEIPKELQGTWIKNTDTCYVFAKGYTDATAKFDSTGKVVIGVKRESTLLSEKMILNKAGKYYVANFLTDDGSGWQVVIIEKKENGEIHWYYPATPPFFGSSKTLIVKKVERTKKKKKITNKSLLKVEGEHIDKVFYTGQFTIDDIKKVTIKENTIRILKTDGTYIDDMGNK